MHCECTVLCENSVAGSLGFIGEHGWAVHINTGERKILFDTGQGLGLIHNAKLLKVDLQDLDAIVISHGHYDHTSGLPDVLHQTGAKDIYMHPYGFNNRYWVKDEECREIGIRYKKEYLESLGATFKPITELTEIFENIFLTGEVPRVSSFEKPDPFMKLKTADGGWIQDELLDDQSLIIRSNNGLVIILGCAHAGLINILTHVKKNFPDEKLHAVFGGTHLGFADDSQFDATVQALREYNIQKIGASHCTGLTNCAKLYNEFGERFFFSSVGTRFTSD